MSSPSNGERKIDAAAAAATKVNGDVSIPVPDPPDGSAEVVREEAQRVRGGFHPGKIKLLSTNHHFPNRGNLNHQSLDRMDTLFNGNTVNLPSTTP